MQNYVIVIVTFIPTEPQLNILFTLILHSVMHMYVCLIAVFVI